MTTGVWLVLLVLAGSVWLGGYVAIAVVARAASATLEAPARVAFFRALGRAYLPVGGAALLLALVSGGALLAGRMSEPLALAASVVAVLLAVLLAVAVAQARRMTRLRRRLGEAPHDHALAATVRGGARAATGLRALLGLLSVALVVMGCLLAA